MTLVADCSQDNAIADRVIERLIHNVSTNARGAGVNLRRALGLTEPSTQPPSEAS